MLVAPPKAVWQGGAVHLVPNQLDIERVLADEKPLEVLVDDAARKGAATVVRAKSAHSVVGENLDDERVLPAAHPQRTDAGVFRVDGHGIGNERLGLPAAAPVLGFPLRRAACAGVSAFDRVQFDAGDFHLNYLLWFSRYRLAECTFVRNGQNDNGNGLFVTEPLRAAVKAQPGIRTRF